jgi:hypothetical protein
MNATDDTTGTIRELAHRSGDGIEVTLFWDSLDDRLTVRAWDTRTGEFFEIEAPRHAALDVFQHPFAWAPERVADEVESGEPRVQATR